MKKLLPTAIAALSCLFPSLSHAGFDSSYMEADWKNEGDRKLFVSIGTQQVFLKLTETTGESTESIHERLSTDLLGWRMATESDMDRLFEEMTGLTPNADNSRQSVLQDSTTDNYNVHSLLGVTYTSSDYDDASKGNFIADDGSTRAFSVTEWRGDDYVNYMYNRCSYCNYYNTGIWLMPDENNLTLFQQNNVEYNTISDVSTPAALPALSLLLLGFRRRQVTLNQGDEK